MSFELPEDVLKTAKVQYALV